MKRWLYSTTCQSQHINITYILLPYYYLPSIVLPYYWYYYLPVAAYYLHITISLTYYCSTAILLILQPATPLLRSFISRSTLHITSVLLPAFCSTAILLILLPATPFLRSFMSRSALLVSAWWEILKSQRHHITDITTASLSILLTYYLHITDRDIKLHVTVRLTSLSVMRQSHTSAPLSIPSCETLLKPYYWYYYLPVWNAAEALNPKPSTLNHITDITTCQSATLLKQRRFTQVNGKYVNWSETWLCYLKLLCHTQVKVNDSNT